MDRRASVDVVVLSQGDRQNETLRALDSARVQRGVDVTLILVGNGWEPVGFPDDVRTVHLEANLGPAEGRNIGVAHGTSELIFFLDNDAWLSDDTALARAVARFRAEQRLGLVHARVADTDGVTLRRWVPRARVGDPNVGGPAFSVCEGVVALRRSAYEEVHGFPGNFFFGHEGIELAWRLRDRGWELTYDPSVLIHHPATEATRHALFWRLNARNRVWVARRNLPWPLAAVYIGTWTAITIARTWRQPANLRIWFRGLREGVRTSPGERRPMRWRTLWTLTRLGHPPVV
ncbi:MAG: glycosyltransferase [Nocardioidaceae bacterium]|nr:glycosyltransferase [Nocardioidaceae bacterium]